MFSADMSLERSLSHLCLFEGGNKTVVVAYSSQTDFSSCVATIPSYTIALAVLKYMLQRATKERPHIWTHSAVVLFLGEGCSNSST